MSLHREGQWEIASSRYHQILALDPQHLEAIRLLGVLAFQRGEYQVASDWFGQALSINPAYAEAHNNLGLLLYTVGRIDEAHQSYRRALSLKPDFPDALSNISQLVYEQGDSERAIQYCYRALALTPDFPEALNNLGAALAGQNKLEAAIVNYRRAIELNPNFADAYNNLGSALQAQGEDLAAVHNFRQAIDYNPNFTDAYINLGTVLQDQQQLDLAINCYQKALSIDPNQAKVFNNLGIIYQERGELQQATNCYHQSLIIDEGYVEGHYNLGLAQLLAGNYEDGWANFEWRLKTKKYQLDLPGQVWNGSKLNGRTLLVYSEQGLGDTIQFVRFFWGFSQFNGRVILQCQDKLQSLLQPLTELSPIIAVVGQEEPTPAFDVWTALMSLPYLLNIHHIDTTPNPVPYLGSIQTAEIPLRHTPAFKVGIVWAGNPSHKNDRYRSTTLQQFRRLFDISGCQFYSLQVGEAANQIEPLLDRYPITNLAQSLNDFTETASVVAQLDLVISVDTSVAHLAGAMGKLVWTLLPANPDWRWLQVPRDTLWYPTMRLFRQSRLGDWSLVFDQLHAELTSVADGQSQP